MTVDLNKVDEILSKKDLRHESLIHTLLDVQDELFYLPREALERVSERMKIPLVQVVQVASFYKAFSLEPRGKHLLRVCLGTACHVRGGERIFDQLQRILDVEPGGTTRDDLFTLEAVNCLGCCASGPVMVIDGKYYGMMAASKVERVLKKFKGNGKESIDDKS